MAEKTENGSENELNDEELDMVVGSGRRGLQNTADTLGDMSQVD